MGDLEKCISFSLDLVEVLKNKKDVGMLRQSLEGAKMLQSYCGADFYEVENLLRDYEKKIDTCKQRIDEVKCEILGDKDLDSLENVLEEELRKEHSLMEELRIVNDQISDLELHRATVEGQKKNLNKHEKDDLRSQMNLSMYASVTKVVPYIYDKTKISGYIVEKDRSVVQKFEFDPTEATSLDICNNLWTLIGS